MRLEVKAGTPHHLESKTYPTAAPAKNWLKGRFKSREEWAHRFNVQLEDRIRAAREEFDGIDLSKLPVGETRQWAATDDVSGVQFVFKVKKVEA